MQVKGFQCCFGLDWHGFPHEEESKSQFWKDMRMSKWQNLHFWENYLFKTKSYSICPNAVTHSHTRFKSYPQQQSHCLPKLYKHEPHERLDASHFPLSPPAWLFFMDENKFKRRCKLKDTHLQSWPVTTEWVGHATLQLDNTTTSLFN